MVSWNMPNILTKYELIIIRQYLRSILDKLLLRKADVINMGY